MREQVDVYYDPHIWGEKTALEHSSGEGLQQVRNFLARQAQERMGMQLHPPTIVQKSRQIGRSYAAELQEKFAHAWQKEYDGDFNVYDPRTPDEIEPIFRNDDDKIFQQEAPLQVTLNSKYCRYHMFNPDSYACILCGISANEII